MTAYWTGVALCVAGLLADPLALFKPTVALDERQRRALDQRDAVVQALSMPSRHIGVFVAVRVGADADRVARWLDQIAAALSLDFTYVYQARIDRLAGFFGRIARHFVERELKDRAGATLAGLRNRLESGDPAVAISDVPR